MSTAFIKDPWKYWTLVCRFFKSLSSFKSGVELKENIFKPPFKFYQKKTCAGKPLQRQHSPDPCGESLLGSLMRSRMKYPHRRWCACDGLHGFSISLTFSPSPCFLFVGARILGMSPNQFNNFRDAWSKHCLMTSKVLIKNLRTEIVTKPTKMNKTIAIFPRTVWHEISP